MGIPAVGDGRFGTSERQCRRSTRYVIGSYERKVRTVMSYNTPATKKFELIQFLQNVYVPSIQTSARVVVESTSPPIEPTRRLRQMSRYGWKSIGIGGSSRMSVMVTRRFAAM
jgi:hypothetical protein